MRGYRRQLYGHEVGLWRQGEGGEGEVSGAVHLLRNRLPRPRGPAANEAVPLASSRDPHLDPARRHQQQQEREACSRAGSRPLRAHCLEVLKSLLLFRLRYVPRQGRWMEL